MATEIKCDVWHKNFPLVIFNFMRTFYATFVRIKVCLSVQRSRQVWHKKILFMQQAKSGIKFSLYAARKKFLFYANVCMTGDCTISIFNRSGNLSPPLILARIIVVSFPCRLFRGVHNDLILCTRFRNHLISGMDFQISGMTSYVS